MKKYLISTFICTLLALVGCQQNEEFTQDVQSKGEKVTLIANIQGSTNGRVALTPDNDDDSNPIVKVAWRTDGELETFQVSGASIEGENLILTGPITFTQKEDRSNVFSSTEEWPAAQIYNVGYNLGLGTFKFDQYDLSNQNGTLDENNVLMRSQFYPGEEDDPIQFEHLTFILKPTFKVGDEVINSTITKIVMGNVKKPTDDVEVGTITINREASADDIYIFVPFMDSYCYNIGEEITYEVTTSDDKTYSGTLTFTTPISYFSGHAGKLFTATIALEKKPIPYVTFSATGAQKFKIQPYSNDQYIDDGISGLYFSTDNGNNWTEYSESVAIDNGVEFGNGTDLLLKGTLATGTNWAKISFTETAVPVACSGDIRTLIAGDGYATATTSSAVFGSLFYGCTALVSASGLQLPATDLAEYCYYEMFKNCTGLTTAPALDAENLASGCYSCMFEGCTSLETAPALPATTLAEECYEDMFSGCTQLTSAPALPATTLTYRCYFSMFEGCTSLETAPTLKATTLAEFCYSYMFSGCTSLETAPELPATTLDGNCYRSMFSGCTSLSSITMLATSISDGCLLDWVNGVAETGTFYKNSAADWENSDLGLPEGWTINNYTGE